MIIVMIIVQVLLSYPILKNIFLYNYIYAIEEIYFNNKFLFSKNLRSVMDEQMQFDRFLFLAAKLYFCIFYVIRNIITYITFILNWYTTNMKYKCN